MITLKSTSIKRWRRLMAGNMTMASYTPIPGARQPIGGVLVGDRVRLEREGESPMILVVRQTSELAMRPGTHLLTISLPSIEGGGS